MHKKTLLALAVFAALGFLALQVPLFHLVGSKARFTLYDLVGPMAGGFLGTWLGVLAVFVMQAANFLVHGAKVLDAGTVIRFLPMLFGAAYFARKSRWILVVPVLAIASFVINPVGRTAWVYSMFWLIPIMCHFFRDKSLLARSLGATYTAHAVGGALWVWAFHLPRAVWIGLIPITIMERLIMTAGIALSFALTTKLLGWLVRTRKVSLPFNLDQRILNAPLSW